MKKAKWNEKSGRHLSYPTNEFEKRHILSSHLDFYFLPVPEAMTETFSLALKFYMKKKKPKQTDERGGKKTVVFIYVLPFS